MNQEELGQRVLEICHIGAPWVCPEHYKDYSYADMGAFCGRCGMELYQEPFTLHSGARTNVLFDVGRLFLHENREVLKECIKWLKDQTSKSYEIYGIPTLGAALAALVTYRPRTYPSLDLNLSIFFDGYSCIDDVCTTGSSFKPIFERSAAGCC